MNKTIESIVNGKVTVEAMVDKLVEQYGPTGALRVAEHRYNKSINLDDVMESNIDILIVNECIKRVDEMLNYQEKENNRVKKWIKDRVAERRIM